MKFRFLILYPRNSSTAGFSIRNSLKCGLWILLLSTFLLASIQKTPGSRQSYVPPEMQVTDPKIAAILESADNSAKLGNYGECLDSLQKARDVATKEKSLSDRAIVEDKIGVYYFAQGKLEDAKSQWLKALSDGIATSNLVLQADVLVALSALQQSSGQLDQAMHSVNQALELARKSKSLYIESRVLGELGRLQLVSGKREDAQASINEALEIDRLNRYDWQAGHLLFLAWVKASDSKIDEAISLATTARRLAIEKDNYLVFIQASVFLGQGYVHAGKAAEGIRLLQLSQHGISEQGKPLFNLTEDYTRTASLPYLKITFLEALALAYEASKRPDDALNTWHNLYDTAAAAGFTLARAESARHLADLYKAKKDFENSITNYALAANAYKEGGNEEGRAEALTAEAALLFQQNDKDKVVSIEEDILPLAKASNNLRLQFLANLVIAEALDGSQRVDRLVSALNSAESLVGPDVRVPAEKAITPALALANAPGNEKNDKPLRTIVQSLQKQIPEYHIRETGETAFNEGKMDNALILLEIVQYFDEMDASWKGQWDQYHNNVNANPIIARLVQIPAKLISQDGGAPTLENNIEHMGPLADRVRPLTLGLLISYYMSHQRPDFAVKFARQALALKGWDSEIAGPWRVAISCELATALTLERDVTAAVEIASQCLAGAAHLLGRHVADRA